jgi:hypothetical protein
VLSLAVDFKVGCVAKMLLAEGTIVSCGWLHVWQSNERLSGWLIK